MTLIEKIKTMSPSELAKFMIVPGEVTDTDEDYNGDTYQFMEYCYYTPFGIYTGWWSEDDVIIDIAKKLMLDEGEYYGREKEL